MCVYSCTLHLRCNGPRKQPGTAHLLATMACERYTHAHRNPELRQVQDADPVTSASIQQNTRCLRLRACGCYWIPVTYAALEDDRTHPCVPPPHVHTSQCISAVPRDSLLQSRAAHTSVCTHTYTRLYVLFVTLPPAHTSACTRGLRITLLQGKNTHPTSFQKNTTQSLNFF